MEKNMEHIPTKTFEQYLEEHPYPNTRSFTKEDWEGDMWEHWNDEYNSPAPSSATLEGEQFTKGEWEIDHSSVT